MVGAGVAGSVAARVLAGEGLSVLVVEPGQHIERRLAGELLHPPGVAGLRDLGFCLPPPGGQAVPTRGFAVYHAPAAEAEPSLLPYVGPTPTGLALSHGLLRAHLAAQVTRLDGVETILGARVTGLDLDRPDQPVVLVRRGPEEVRVGAQIVIAADGAGSPTRKMAGIGHRRRQLSTLVGLLACSDALPCPGFGHLFLGSAAPALAYAISDSQARVMFDLPVGTGAGAIPAAQAAALPPALRDAVARGSSTLRYNSHDMTVQCAVRDRVALVGDAGGSCHPLTATGMTVAVNDGLALRAALRARPGDFGAALRAYGRHRRAAQRTRRLIASALYETCSGSGPELLVIRRGLERYWRNDARGRAASMALLAMVDVRLRSALWEMLSVIRHGMLDDASPSALLYRSRLMVGLSRLVVRHMGEAIRVR